MQPIIQIVIDFSYFRRSLICFCFSLKNVNNNNSMDYRAGGIISFLSLDCLLINANPDFIFVVMTQQLCLQNLSITVLQ